MSPSTQSELRSPTFILAAAAFGLSIAGGIYTLGIQSQRLDAATEKNKEQDVIIEKLGDKMDAGFSRVADKIDALRTELKKP